MSKIRTIAALVAATAATLSLFAGPVPSASAEITKTAPVAASPVKAAVVTQKVVDVPRSSDAGVSAKGVAARIVWGDYRNLRSFAAYSGRNCRGHMYSVAAKQLSHPGIDSVFQAPYVEMSAYGGLKTWKATSKGACHNLTVPFQVNRIRVKGGVSSWAIKPNASKH